MPPQRTKRGQKKPRSSPAEGAVDKLLSASQMIQYRTRVRPGEAKRVKDALALSNQDNPPDSTLRGENYWEFLRSVNRSCGAAMVGLCALGLGRSAIGSMKERSRLELAELVKQRQQDLTCEVLQDFLQNASTGRAFDLAQDL